MEPELLEKILGELNQSSLCKILSTYSKSISNISQTQNSGIHVNLKDVKGRDISKKFTSIIKPHLQVYYPHFMCGFCEKEIQLIDSVVCEKCLPKLKYCEFSSCSVNLPIGICYKLKYRRKYLDALVSVLKKQDYIIISIACEDECEYAKFVYNSLNGVLKSVEEYYSDTSIKILRDLWYGKLPEISQN